MGHGDECGVGVAGAEVILQSGMEMNARLTLFLGMPLLSIPPERAYPVHRPALPLLLLPCGDVCTRCGQLPQLLHELVVGASATPSYIEYVTARCGGGGRRSGVWIP